MCQSASVAGDNGYSQGYMPFSAHPPRVLDSARVLTQPVSQSVSEAVTEGTSSL